MGANTRLVQSINKQNPGIDTAGTLQDIFITPVSNEIDSLDARITATRMLFSGDFDSTRSAEEIEKVAGTRGRIRNPGKYASGTVTLRAPAAPYGLVLQAGTIVSTPDQAYQYTITEEVAPSTTEVNASYNPQTQYYEIDFPVRAIQIGSMYNIAATKIRYTSITLPSGSYIINTSAITGGEDQQTLQSLWDDYQSASVLADTSSQQGLAERITNQFKDSGLTDTFVSSDIGPPSPTGNAKPAIDIFVLGEDIQTDNHEVTLDSTGVIVLPHTFVQDVTTITKNGDPVLGYTRDDNTIQITEQFAVDDDVFITYTYNALLENVQTAVSELSSDLFNFRLVVQAGDPEDLGLVVTVRVQMGLSGLDIQAQIESALISYYAGLLFTTDDLSRFDISTYLKNQFPGIVSAEIDSLVVLSQSQQLTGFPLYVAPPKYPRLLSSNLTVNVRTS